MKRLFLILLLIPLFGLSQHLKETPIVVGILSDWKIYLTDCNQLVADTVIQTGTVNVEYKPVMSKGKITHFILAPIDTVWQKVECLDYKYQDFQDYAINSNWRTNNGVYFTSGNITLANSITYSQPEAKSKITITRKKICQIKKHKASWEDFCNRWCKEKRIIEFN